MPAISARASRALPLPASARRKLNIAKLVLQAGRSARLKTRAFYSRARLEKPALVQSIQDTREAFVACLPRFDEPVAPAEMKTVWLGTDSVLRSLTAELHLLCHDAFHGGRGEAPPRTAGELAGPVRKTRIRYLRALDESRRLTQHGDVQGLRDLAASLVAYLVSDVADLLAKTASTSETDLNNGSFFGLQAADLARRLVALGVGCLYLSVQLQDSRRAPSARSAAKKCRKLTRLDMRLSRSLRHPGRRVDRTLAIKGKLDHVKFFNRPRKPFTVANIVGTQTILLAPYKSLLRMGVTNGSSFWAVGRIRKLGGAYLFEVEFEGAGQHSKTYWEDHLAYLLRHHYNLYPSALRMAWEFPDVRRSSAISDLVGRTR